MLKFPVMYDDEGVVCRAKKPQGNTDCFQCFLFRRRRYWEKCREAQIRIAKEKKIELKEFKLEYVEIKDE